MALSSSAAHVDKLDSKQTIFGSADGKVEVWSADTGKLQRVMGQTKTLIQSKITEDHGDLGMVLETNDDAAVVKQVTGTKESEFKQAPAVDDQRNQGR